MNLTIFQMADFFYKKFGMGGDIRAYFAPGRVNLIGEHIDYNGGHVFPCALTVGNHVIIRKRTDRKIRFYSYNYKRGGIMESSLDNLKFSKKDGWINYPKGVIWSFYKRGMILDCGFDAFVFGNIPGSGLSSSAAMEVSFATAIQDLYHFSISPIEIAKLCQFSENHFNGMNCGIMDQFASAMGKKDNALFLDCKTLDFQYVPMDLKGVSIIVTNSGKSHSLSHSHYNERREECERALSDLKKVVDISCLCQLSVEEFERYKIYIRDEISRRRAKHAVYEERRTKDAIKALKSNDIDELGRLLNESGDSLRYEYDATCYEIDVLVDEQRSQKGVYGSRETGGGWGGNTISIVQNQFVDSFIQNVGKKYFQKTNLKPNFTILNVGDGARRLA